MQSSLRSTRVGTIISIVGTIISIVGSAFALIGYFLPLVSLPSEQALTTWQEIQAVRMWQQAIDAIHALPLVLLAALTVLCISAVALFWKLPPRLIVLRRAAIIVGLLTQLLIGFYAHRPVVLELVTTPDPGSCSYCADTTWSYLPSLLEGFWVPLLGLLLCAMGTAMSERLSIQSPSPFARIGTIIRIVGSTLALLGCFLPFATLPSDRALLYWSSIDGSWLLLVLLAALTVLCISAVALFWKLPPRLIVLRRAAIIVGLLTQLLIGFVMLTSGVTIDAGELPTPSLLEGFWLPLLGFLLCGAIGPLVTRLGSRHAEPHQSHAQAG